MAFLFFIGAIRCGQVLNTFSNWFFFCVWSMWSTNTRNYFHFILSVVNWICVHRTTPPQHACLCHCQNIDIYNLFRIVVRNQMRWGALPFALGTHFIQSFMRFCRLHISTRSFPVKCFVCNLHACQFLLHAIKHRDMSLFARMIEKVWPQENRSQTLKWIFRNNNLPQNFSPASLNHQFDTQNARIYWTFRCLFHHTDKIIELDTEQLACSMFVYYLKNIICKCLVRGRYIAQNLRSKVVFIVENSR